jgi:hypothetical protein
MSVNSVPPAGGSAVAGAGDGTTSSPQPQPSAPQAATRPAGPAGLAARRAPATQGVRVALPPRIARLPPRRAVHPTTAPDGPPVPVSMPGPAPETLQAGAAGPSDTWRMQQQMQDSMAQQQFMQMQWQVKMGQMDMLRRLADAFGGAAKAAGESIARLVGN